MWILYGILSAIFAAVMAVSIKLGLKDLDPYLSLTVRTFFVLFYCISLIIIKGNFKEIYSINLKGFIYLIVASVATFLTWLFYFLAMDKGSVTKVLALDKLSIVITLVLSVLFLNEKITWLVLLGISLLLVGSILIVLS